MLRINQAVITGGSFTQVNAASRETPFGADGFQILQTSVADGAFHNSKERFDPPKCHEKTRIAVLQRILDWVFRQDEDTCDTFIMWLYGPAGAGKSAIMQTIAERTDVNDHLAASFFFSRNHPTRGDADRLIATLAYQLALILPPQFRQDIVLAIEHDPLIFSKTLDVQFRELISGPMEQLLVSGWSTNHTYLLIIDGVDECDNPQIQPKIIDLALKAHGTSQHLPLLFLVASRPELEIVSSFESCKSTSVFLRTALDDYYSPDDDIREYMLAEFNEIKTIHRFRSSILEPWPSEEAVATLVAKSSGQFTYTATVVKCVASVRRRPTECLDKILGLRPIGKDTPFLELDALYRHIIAKVDDLETVLMVIGAVYLKPSLVSLRELWNIHTFCEDINSLLSIVINSYRNPETEELRISHASLSDFLFDQSRSLNLWVSPENLHSAFVNKCLTILNGFLTASQVEYRYVILIGYYILWVQSLTRWETPEMEQFRMGQLEEFDMHLASQLDVYFSFPELLWALVITTTFQHICLIPTTRLSKQLDSRGLMLYHLSAGRTSENGSARYLDAISAFLNDPGRTGKYFMTGVLYTGLSLHVLRHLCSRMSCPLPRSLSKLYVRRRRNFPATWHRQQARRDFDLRPGYSQATHFRFKKAPQRQEFLAHRRFLDRVGWNVYRSEDDRDYRAYGVLGGALPSLPYLLEKSAGSEELINLAQTTIFGTMAKNPWLSDEVRAAEKAIKSSLLGWKDPEFVGITVLQD